MITLLNTSITTSLNDFSARACSREEAQNLIASQNGEVQSAIGHQATADILTELLGFPVTVNRIEYKQQPGEMAVVFKLNGRAPEGVILDREQVEKIGYSFQLLYCMQIHAIEQNGITDAREAMREMLRSHR